MSSIYGRQRESEISIYRAITNRVDKEYVEGRQYRFITFQSCSNNANKAIKYKDGNDNAFYTISLPKSWRNGLSLTESSPDNIRNTEYLIIPFTRFELESIYDRMDESTSEKLIDNSQSSVIETKYYRMKLSNEVFYEDKDGLEWFNFKQPEIIS